MSGPRGGVTGDTVLNVMHNIKYKINKKVEST